mmetsp:Transcript_14028/g.19928  ORF Transcript_14028/g.19928 Transcript_14028/m.19928 type:complete len:411 (+) Transcript_14028:39-1271(+)
MMSSSSVVAITRVYWRRRAIDTIRPSRTFSSTIQKQDTSNPNKHRQKSPLLTNNNELSAIVNSFPTTGLDYAFGYGSGVLKQQSSSAGMVDIILAVDDPYAWHTHNLQSQPHHYSGFARVGGPRFVHWMQNLGARLYFHPFVDVEINHMTRNDEIDANTHPTTIQREIKYGVVSTDELIKDLTCWKYLYLAGRMHKPTVEIDLMNATLSEHEDQSMQEQEVVNRRDEIAEAQRQNLLAAVSASILLHGGQENRDTSLPIIQLYNTIAGISYAGDIRMQTGAEDPNKVKKLVETPGMQALWDGMYATIFSDMQSLGILTKDDVKLELDFDDIAMRKQLILNLPKRLQFDEIVGVASSKDSIHRGSELLRAELANIVAPAAKSQSIKGFFSAGVSKSFKYAMAKFAKGRLKK